MNKARKKITFPIPDTYKELGEKLKTLKFLQKFYRGYAEAGAGEEYSVCFIFITDTMLRALKKVIQLLADGTFKVLFRHPKMAQLYTIHFRVADTVNKFFKKSFQAGLQMGGYKGEFTVRQMPEQMHKRGM